jgi:hypothetical protein
MQKSINLPIYNICVCVDSEGIDSITSNLKTTKVGCEDYNTAIEGVESLVLSHACTGLDITTPKYLEGIEAAVDGIREIYS